MAGKPKPKRPYKAVNHATQLLQGPKDVVPIDQLAKYYGGRAGVREAVEQAQGLSDAVYPAMRDIDPEMAEMFPPVNYDNYERPQGFYPYNDGDPTAPMAQTFGVLDDLPEVGDANRESIVQMILDDPDPEFRGKPGTAVNMNMEARRANQIDPHSSSPETIANLIEQPLTTNITDYFGMLPEGLDIRGTPLISQDEATELARALMDGPDYQPGAADAPDQYVQATADAIRDRSKPYRVDQALSQLRRTSGDPMGDMSDILVNAQIDAGQAMSRGEYPGQTVGKSGLTVADLIALANLPERVRMFSATRGKMLPGLIGGAAAGSAAGQYSMSQDPNMIGRSTMGGVTY